MDFLPRRTILRLSTMLVAVAILLESPVGQQGGGGGGVGLPCGVGDPGPCGSYDRASLVSFHWPAAAVPHACNTRRSPRPSISTVRVVSARAQRRATPPAPSRARDVRGAPDARWPATPSLGSAPRPATRAAPHRPGPCQRRNHPRPWCAASRRSLRPVPVLPRASLPVPVWPLRSPRTARLRSSTSAACTRTRTTSPSSRSPSPPVRTPPLPTTA